MSIKPVTDPRCRQKAVVKKVKDESGTKGLEGVFYIGLPAETILDILWDPANFSELYPSVKEHQVKAHAENRLDIEYVVDAMLKEVRYVIRRTRAPGSIEWRELSGDLKRVRGGWWAEPTDDPQVSKLIYRAFVAVSYFVPSGMVAAGAKRKMDEMVDRVRRVATEIAARSAQ